MTDFEDASLDQFPLRDTFREAKSLFHRFVLRQSDKSGIYVSQGHAAAQEYPLSEASVSHALELFSSVYETYLSSTDSKIYLAIVPDKGYYLAQSAGQLSLDYDRLFTMVEGGMPWASPIRLTDSLSIQDYYRTDTHWRQERLLPAAQALCQALGVSSPRQEDYTVTPVDKPFYGVYYGQAALPMQPDTMYLLKSDLLDDCRVYDYETGETTAVYDMTKLDSKDLYDVYLSGARSLLTIGKPQRGHRPGADCIPGFLRKQHGSAAGKRLRQGDAGRPSVHPKRLSGQVPGLPRPGRAVSLQHAAAEQQRGNQMKHQGRSDESGAPLMRKKVHCNLTTTVDLAEDEGFEPPQTESESGVLPLHKSSI